jgi:hypothetical protein
MSLELLTSVDFLGLLGHNQKRALNAACLCMYACITCLDHHWSEPAVTQYCDELVAQFSALFSATAKSQDEHLPVGIMTAVRVAVLVGEKSPILERIFPEFLSFLLSFQSSTKIDVVNAAKACLLSLESQFVPSLNDTAEAVGGTLETLLATLGRTTEWHGVVMLLNLLHQFFNRFKFIVNGEQVEKLHLTAKKNLYHPIISVATSAAGLLSWLLYPHRFYHTQDAHSKDLLEFRKNLKSHDQLVRIGGTFGLTSLLSAHELTDKTGSVSITKIVQMLSILSCDNPQIIKIAEKALISFWQDHKLRWIQFDQWFDEETVRTLKGSFNPPSYIV